MTAFNRRSKKNRSTNALFNPYVNGISTYDLAYLSSKKNVFKHKIINPHFDIQTTFTINR